MLYYRSPLAVITFAKSGLTKPADLVGKTLGDSITDGAYRLFPAYCQATGLDPNSVKWKFVDLRLRETLLLRGEVDAILGFDSTSYFNLVKAGAKPGDIKFLYYSDAGLPLYGNSLAASKKMIDTSPDIVKRFVAASAKGWLDAVKDPAAAIAALSKKDSLTDAKLETEKPNWVIEHQILSPESRDRVGCRRSGPAGELDRHRQTSVRAAGRAAGRAGVRPPLPAPCCRATASGMSFDVVIRGGTVATAADVVRADIGITGGRGGDGRPDRRRRPGHRCDGAAGAAGRDRRALPSGSADGPGFGQRRSEATIPMGRYGKPEEVADMVTFLASARASYVTGSMIRVDGGIVRHVLAENPSQKAPWWPSNAALLRYGAHGANGRSAPVLANPRQPTHHATF